VSSSRKEWHGWIPAEKRFQKHMHLRQWPNMVSSIMKQMSQLNSYRKMVPETYRNIWSNDQRWLAQSWNSCHSWICAEKQVQKHVETLHLKQLPNMVSQIINFFCIWTNYQIWWAHWTPSAFEYSTPLSSLYAIWSSIFNCNKLIQHPPEFNIQL